MPRRSISPRPPRALGPAALAFFLLAVASPAAFVEADPPPTPESVAVGVPVPPESRWETRLGVAQLLLDRMEAGPAARSAPSVDEVGHAVRELVATLVGTPARGRTALPGRAVAAAFEAVLRYEEAGGREAVALVDWLSEVFRGLPDAGLERRVVEVLDARTDRVAPERRRRWVARAARLFDGRPTGGAFHELARRHRFLVRSARLSLDLARIGEEVWAGVLRLDLSEDHPGPWGRAARAGPRAEGGRVGLRRLAARLRRLLEATHQVEDLVVAEIPERRRCRTPLAAFVFRPREPGCAALPSLRIEFPFHDGRAPVVLPVTSGPVRLPEGGGAGGRPEEASLVLEAGGYADRARAVLEVQVTGRGGWPDDAALFAGWEGLGPVAPAGVPSSAHEILAVGDRVATTRFVRTTRHPLEGRGSGAGRFRFPRARDPALPVARHWVAPGTQLPGPVSEDPALPPTEERERPLWTRAIYLALIFLGTLVIVVGVVLSRNRARAEEEN